MPRKPSPTTSPPQHARAAAATVTSGGGQAPARLDGLPSAVRPHLVGVPIYKMTGSGNDFVMLDARLSVPGDWNSADIHAVCARGTGVGADGLVFVGPGSQPGAVRMVYFNADGSRAAMCGNAALCATFLAARLGVAPAEGMLLETDAGVYESRCVAAGAAAELHLAPVAVPTEVPGLVPADGERGIVLGVVGVPHLVVLVADVDAVNLPERGRELRSDPAIGPGGANVNFVSSGTDAAEWRMRTYERGVEAETLACGTGAVAAACALTEWGLTAPPVTVLSRSGRPLRITAHRTPRGQLFDDVWLAGEARLVMRGVLA